MSFNTPILFLVFNRPETTRKVFKQIREIKPTFLYIAADGPRNDKASDRELCLQVRELILSGIDWPCEVKTLFRGENLGCGKAVSGAISWFFDQVEEGIILEDDCLPDLSFFEFCNVMLERYRNNEKIMHIGGNNFQFGALRGDGDYYYSRYTHIWGWATWRRAWKLYNYQLTKEEISLRKVENAFNYNLPVITYWKNVLDKVAFGEVDTWDYQWLYTSLRENKMAVCPNYNLVKNIGFGIEATHTKSATEISALEVSSMVTFKQPSKLKLDEVADLYTMEKVFGVTCQKSKWPKRMLKASKCYLQDALFSLRKKFV